MLAQRQPKNKAQKQPSAILQSIEAPFHMETRMTADGGFLCLLFGIRGIRTYTESEMAFTYKGGAVTIRGSALFCRTFLNKTVQISGFIEEICMERQGRK